MTVLQPRRTSRALLTTFLVGWLVAALSLLVAVRVHSGEVSWLSLLAVPIMPAMPAFVATGSLGRDPLWLGPVMSAIALVPVAVYLLGRRANRRGRLVLCIVMAGWWLGFAAVGWWYILSDLRM